MKKPKIYWALRNHFLKKIIAEIERDHFRTEHDTGANDFAMLMHNYYRSRAGLPFLKLADLPKWCEFHKAYDLCHNKEK